MLCGCHFSLNHHHWSLVPTMFGSATWILLLHLSFYSILLNRLLHIFLFFLSFFLKKLILLYVFSATTLTGFHFGVTALVGFVSNATGYSASKHVPLWELLWFSIVANMSITGMNFSLMLNSVGFYQVRIIGQTLASIWCAFFLFVSGSYCCSCDVDFQAEHDSSCLCHGMDTSWQALLKRSEDGCGCSCCRSGCLYSDGCKSESEGFYLCLRCSLIYIIATNNCIDGTNPRSKVLPLQITMLNPSFVILKFLWGHFRP